MKFISYDSKVTLGYTAVALGNFDGVHIGHQALINNMIRKSNDNGLIPSVLLFNTHTSSTLNDKKTPFILMSNLQKIEALEDMGVKLIYNIEFDENIMHMSPDKFVKEILKERLNAKLLVAGFNYHFGYKASGDSNCLKILGNKNGIDVAIIKPVYHKGNIVSSTMIRNLLKEGKIKQSRELLGKPYEMIGKVIKGKGLGKKLGFPTANISLDDNYLIPKHGVYKTITEVSGQAYKSITNIGNNPTFDETNTSIETHIINFNQDIYGSNVKVKFIDYIREERKFNSEQELINQIKSDIINSK